MADVCLFCWESDDGVYSCDFVSEQFGSLLPDIFLPAGHAPDQRGEKVASQEPCL